MSVLGALEEALKDADAPKVQVEMARALAEQIDEGKGVAAAVKELRTILSGLMEEEAPVDDGLDEVARKRDARRAG